MKFFYTLFFIFAFTLKTISNGGYITISSVVPTSITICGQSKFFSFTISNPSAFNLTGVTVSLTMPNGISYQAGSVTNATELSILPSYAPTFSVANIPSLSSVVITFTAAANCDILTHLSLGLPIENKIKVDYTAGSNTTFDNHTTQTYIIKQPNLSIISITNQSYTGSIGGTFSRCITITNGGSGELSAFTLTDTHGSGLQITAASPGIWVGAAGTETYSLNGTNFTSIGNGNNIFENGESITICETVSITNCSSVNSLFDAGWGCGSQICQSSSSSANIIFPNNIPNLVITTQPSANICKGSGHFSPQSLKVVNTGVGQAVNTVLSIYNTYGGNFDPTERTEIDITSFTIKINNAAPVPFAVASTSANVAYSCLSSTPIGAVNLNLPPINAGDSVRINWNTKSCCSDGYFNGWGYKADYQSVCLNNYVVSPTIAYGYWNQYLFIGNIVNNGSPSTILSGQTVTFNYLLSGTGFTHPMLADGYWKITFTVSPCYTYSANTIKVLNVNNTATWTPTSVTQVGNVITALFNTPMPFTTEQAQVLIDLTGNCGSCSSGPGQISMGIYFSPSAACGCEIFLNSANFGLNLVCPVNCDGLNFLNYSAKRTSYGLPDNNDDGLPDPGLLNFALIKTSRAMFGDTVTTRFTGKIKTSIAHPNWQYCYANSTITNGNNLTSLGGKLKIYRSNALFATCNITGVAAVAPPATFNYDLSSSALIASGGVSSGFVFLNNDSLIFEPQYKVTTNIGSALIQASTSNSFIVSDVANPTNPANVFSCNTFDGNFSIIGYYYTNYGPDNFSVIGCNQQVISQNYYLSIGPCCNNYAGGNLFPYEYRNWANIDTLKVILPTGYKYVAANFFDIRTSGTFASVSSPVFPISPVNPTASTLEFGVGSYFTGATPTIVASDDGFLGALTVTIEPSCGVTQTIQDYIGYNWIFNSSGFLPLGSANNNSYNVDGITYSGPSIFLQSPLPSITATSNVVVWDISLSNVNNTGANNTWLSAQAISGITVNTVVDVGTSLTITPVGGIYQLGTLLNGTTKNYKFYGTYGSCAKDSIIIQAGWNCQGYPLNVGAYPCVTKKLTLSATPVSPLLVTAVNSPTAPVNLCDSAEYEVIGTNIQTGSAYSLTLSVNIPPGVSIVPGSSQLAYPASSAYTITSNPTFVSGTTYQYNISVLSPSVGTNGLPGILSVGNNSIKIKFKVITTCGYTSGSLASFSFFGVSGCGASTGQLVSLSSQLGIAGASTPYITKTVLKSTFISPCNNSSILKISSQNLGGLSFGNFDSVRVILPAGVSYIPASFIGYNNPPLSTVPVISLFSGQQHLAWKLPFGVTPNDSTVFSIGYAGNPSVLTCNISNFEAKTTSSSALLCTLTGSLCGVQVVTGGDTLPIFTYKSYLSLINASGYSTPNPPLGETAVVNFTINNTGEALNSSNNTVINYYNDVNSNGVYNIGDVLITQHTLNIAIPNNGFYAYNYTLAIPPGAGCHLIAMLDTALNHCSCTPSQISFTLPLKSIAISTTICSGQTANLGYNSITGYSYTWTPSTNLSASNNSNPLVTGSNTTTLPSTTNYIVTVNRNTCISSDTAKVIVNPNPSLNLAPNSATICSGNSVSVSATGANSYSWFPTTGLSSGTVSNVVANPTITTTYTVTGTDLNGCFSSSVNTIFVDYSPTIIVTSNTICSGQSGTISASGASNYTWSPSATLNTVNSATVIATPTVSTIYSVSSAAANGCTATATASVIVNSLPSLTLNTATICTGSNTGLAALGSGAATYTWLPPASLSNVNTPTVIASPTITTTYTLIASSAQGCIQTYTTSIQVNSLPLLVTNNYTICNGTSINVSATGANTYTWFPILGLSTATSSSALANPTITTTYTITGMDLNGCSSSSVSTVLVNPLPNLAVTNNSLCVGQSATISASGAVSYTWLPSSSLNSSSSGTVIANPIIPTVYTVSASGTNACVNSATVAVMVYNLPNLTLNTDTICFGLSGTLAAAGTGASTYTWLPSATLSNANSPSVTASPTISTTYTLISVSAQGCSQSYTTNLVVNPLPVLSTSNYTICKGKSISVNVSGATNYTWSPSLGLNSSTASIAQANPLATTIYTVTGKDLNGCVSSTVSNVLVNLLPDVAINSLSVICAGQSTTLSAAGALSYTWSNGVNTSSQQVSPVTPSFYSVIGTDINGCENSDTTFLNVLIQPTLSITGTPTVCVGNKIQLTASGGINYSWNTGEITNTISISPVSNVVYTVSSGVVPCNSSTVFAVTAYTPATIISHALPGTIVYGFSSTLIADSIASNSNSWGASPDIACTSCETVVVRPKTSTIYTVTIKDNNGCLITNTVLVNVDIICGEVFVPTGFSPNNDGINDFWCVYGNCIETMNIQVFNRWGEKVFESDEKSVCWDGTFAGVKQNDAVFIYQLSATLVNGETVFKKGNLTLVW